MQSAVVMAARASQVAERRASSVRALARRRADLSFENASSIGFRSGGQDGAGVLGEMGN